MNRSDTDPSYFALTITEIQSSVSVVASFKLRNYFVNMASTDFAWRVVSHTGVSFATVSFFLTASVGSAAGSQRPGVVAKFSNQPFP